MGKKIDADIITSEMLINYSDQKKAPSFSWQRQTQAFGKPLRPHGKVFFLLR